MESDQLRRALWAGRFEWRKHVLTRLAEREIKQTDILEVLERGEQIEEYSNDRPYPSALFFAMIRGRLHVVAAFDSREDWAYIITAYEPNLEEFEGDFKTRRRKT